MNPQEQDMDKETSEFQDANRVFQRIDESGVKCEELWIAVNCGEYEQMRMLLVMVDTYFRQFKYICQEKDRGAMEKKREMLEAWVPKELGRIANIGLHQGIRVPPSPKLLKEIRDYLEKAYELRHKYELGSRTKRKIDHKKRARNAVRF